MLWCVSTTQPTKTLYTASGNGRHGHRDLGLLNLHKVRWFRTNPKVGPFPDPNGQPPCIRRPRGHAPFGSHHQTLVRSVPPDDVKVVLAISKRQSVTVGRPDGANQSPFAPRTQYEDFLWVEDAE